jgi:hypothetical protein
MKTNLMKTLAAGCFAATLLFSGCTKTGPAGPTGPAGSNGYVPVSNDGFIKGNLIGTQRNGTAFNYPFNFTSYYNGPSGTMDSTSIGNINFNVARGDLFGNNTASFSINQISSASTTGSLSLNQFTFTQSTGTNMEFQFQMTAGGSFTATNLVYNKTTGLYTGNFNLSLTASQNNTNNTATIVGSFQATITQLVHFNQHVVVNNKY